MQYVDSKHAAANAQVQKGQQSSCLDVSYAMPPTPQHSHCRLHKIKSATLIARVQLSNEALKASEEVIERLSSPMIYICKYLVTWHYVQLAYCTCCHLC